MKGVEPYTVEGEDVCDLLDQMVGVVGTGGGAVISDDDLGTTKPDYDEELARTYAPSYRAVKDRFGHNEQQIVNVYGRTLPSDASSQFTISAVEGNVTVTNSTISAKRIGSIYQVTIVADITVAQLTGANVVQAFNLTLPSSITAFGGSIGSCFIINDESSTSQIGVLQIGGAVEGVCAGITRTVAALEAGSYKLYGQATIIG